MPSHGPQHYSRKAGKGFPKHNPHAQRTSASPIRQSGMKESQSQRLPACPITDNVIQHPNEQKAVEKREEIKVRNYPCRYVIKEKGSCRINQKTRQRCRKDKCFFITLYDFTRCKDMNNVASLFHAFMTRQIFPQLCRITARVPQGRNIHRLPRLIYSINQFVMPMSHKAAVG